MHRTTIGSWLAACLLARLAHAQSGAWHVDETYNIAFERIDPVVDPNAISGHLHRVIGGSRFGASYNFEDYSNAGCSSIQIQADKSNYWMPQLYWINNPGDPATTFTAIPSFNRFYYFLEQDDPAIFNTAFPPGLRMLAGRANNKQPFKNMLYTCHDNGNERDSDNFNYNISCSDGLRTTIEFPVCWDGVNLYSTDGSHVVYPPNGRCPYHHPYRFPRIHLEYTWHPQSFAPGVPLAGRLVWSNGDTTGYGLHADFANGWDVALLQQALEDPRCNMPGNEITFNACPVFAPFANSTAAQNCRLEKGSLSEPFPVYDGLAIPNLPGCNLLWNSGPKPTCFPPVSNVIPPTQSSLLGVQEPLVAANPAPFKLPNSTDWTRVGCYAGAPGWPVLPDALQIPDTNLTVDRCQKVCSLNGHPFASLYRIGSNPFCGCGDSLGEGAGRVITDCNSTCPGNSSQTCGGYWKYDIYYRSMADGNGTLPNTTSSTLIGCYQLPPADQPGLSDAYSFTSNQMTTAMCEEGCRQLRGYSWFGTSSGHTCYCGKSYDLGSGMYVPQDQCQSPCYGNSSQTCGDLYKMSVYTLGVTPPPLANFATLPGSPGTPPFGSLGCYQRTSSVPINYTFNSANMTADACNIACNQIGQGISLVQANTCSCTNTNLTASQLPPNQCDTPCAGNASTTCGGTGAWSAYNSSWASVSLSQIQAAHPPGWIGCYGYGAYNYSVQSGSNSPASCQATCAYFNYPYAQLIGQWCQCSSGLPSATLYPEAACSTTCPGQSDTSCGGPWLVDMYTVNASTSPTFGTIGQNGLMGCNSGKLSNYSYYSVTNTNKKCVAGCAQFGYSLAGTSGNWCNCGNAIADSKWLTPSFCTSTCGGNSSEICGDWWKISVFNTSFVPSQTNFSSSFVGCFTEPSGSRALSGYYFSSSFMTPTLCQNACRAKGFALAGVEYSNQCYCGNTNAGGRVPAATCTYPCAGDSSQICGDWGALSVYNATTPDSPASTSGRALAGWQGCFADPNTLQQAAYSSSFLSPAACVNFCARQNYTLGGLVNGNTCICGGTMPYQPVPGSVCNATCVGLNNASLTCGGPGNTVEVYNISQAALAGWPQATEPSPGYRGCFVDSGKRALGAYSFQSSSMTAWGCQWICNSTGYALAGVQNGVQCWCGNALYSDWQTGYQVADSDCASNCAGDPTVKCGGAWKLGIYAVSPRAPPTLALPSSSTNVSSLGNTTMFNSTTSNGTLGPLTQGLPSMSLNATASVTLSANFSRPTSINATQTSSWLNQTIANQTRSSSLVANWTTSTTAAATPRPTNATGPLDASRIVLLGGAPWVSTGCIIDTDGSAMSGNTSTSANMTLGLCASRCAGWSFFGVKFGSICSCANRLPANRSAPDSDCSINCWGNSSQICGASTMISVYQAASNGTSSVITSPPSWPTWSSASSGTRVSSPAWSPNVTASLPLPTSLSPGVSVIYITVTQFVTINGQPTSTSSVSTITRSSSTSPTPAAAPAVQSPLANFAPQFAPIAPAPVQISTAAASSSGVSATPWTPGTGTTRTSSTLSTSNLRSSSTLSTSRASTAPTTTAMTAVMRNKLAVGPQAPEGAAQKSFAERLRSLVGLN